MRKVFRAAINLAVLLIALIIAIVDGSVFDAMSDKW